MLTVRLVITCRLTAVDAKNHLIVAHEVTNTPDRGQLTAVTKLAQDAVGKTDITVLADKGYYSRSDIKAAQDLGAVVLIPKGDTSGADRKGLFNRSLFKYDQEKDIYICPAGSELQNRFTVVEDGLELQMYFNHIACRDCSQRSRCTTSKRDHAGFMKPKWKIYRPGLMHRHKQVSCESKR